MHGFSRMKTSSTQSFIKLPNCRGRKESKEYVVRWERKPRGEKAYDTFMFLQHSFRTILLLLFLSSKVKSCQVPKGDSVKWLDGVSKEQWTQTWAEELSKGQQNQCSNPSLMRHCLQGQKCRIVQECNVHELLTRSHKSLPFSEGLCSCPEKWCLFSNHQSMSCLWRNSMLLLEKKWAECAARMSPSWQSSTLLTRLHCIMLILIAGFSIDRWPLKAQRDISLAFHAYLPSWNHWTLQKAKSWIQTS